MAFTGRLRPKGYLFQASGVRKGRDFTELKYMKGQGNPSFRFVYKKAQKGSGMPFMAVKIERSEI